MIRLLQQTDQLLYPYKADALVNWQLYRIRLLLRAYGTGYDFCRFYRQEESGALFCALEDHAVVWADQAVDFGELADYIRMTGVSAVSAVGEAGKRLAELLPDFTCQSGMVMEKQADAGLCSDKLREAKAMPALRDCFEILHSAFPLGSFESWYCDLSHRVRHGAASVYLWEQTGCAVVQQDGAQAFLSAVAVRPEARKNGVGSRMLRAIEEKYTGKRLGVYSQNQDSDRFYERLGFVGTEIWQSLLR